MSSNKTAAGNFPGGGRTTHNRSSGPRGAKKGGINNKRKQLLLGSCCVAGDALEPNNAGMVIHKSRPSISTYSHIHISIINNVVFIHSRRCIDLVPLIAKIKLIFARRAAKNVAFANLGFYYDTTSDAELALFPFRGVILAVGRRRHKGNDNRKTIND